MSNVGAREEGRATMGKTVSKYAQLSRHFAGTVASVPHGRLLLSVWGVRLSRGGWRLWGRRRGSRPFLWFDLPC